MKNVEYTEFKKLIELGEHRLSTEDWFQKLAEQCAKSGFVLHWQDDGSWVAHDLDDQERYPFEFLSAGDRVMFSEIAPNDEDDDREVVTMIGATASMILSVIVRYKFI